jgi:hypothetical protein
LVRFTRHSDIRISYEYYSIYDGGGTVGSAGTDYYDVPVATTTGIGTGATFDVYRSSGTVNQIYVNRPGYGYTDGEFVTISADDIGGSGAGAVAIGITVSVDGGATPVGYGSTNAFFDKNFTPSVDSTRPWGVLKQDFDTSKRFGVTYRGFKTIVIIKCHYMLVVHSFLLIPPILLTKVDNIETVIEELIY